MGYMKERYANAQFIIEDLVTLEDIDLKNVPTSVNGLLTALDELAKAWELTHSTRFGDMATLLDTWSNPYKTQWSESDLKGLASYFNRHDKGE